MRRPLSNHLMGRFITRCGIPSWGLSCLLATALMLPSAAALAQDDDDEFEDEEEEDAEEDETFTDDADEDEDDAEDEAPTEGKKPTAADSDSKAAESAKKMVDTSLVGAIDRAPPAGTPLIANKKFPMQFTLEFTGAFDYSYSDRFLSHIGGHGSLAFHIFDWLAIEGFLGGFYPREQTIMQVVRQRGFSFTNLGGQDPALSGLWQSFAFGGAGVQWSPFYGKLSFVSEFDLSFMFYVFGGVAVEGIAKPRKVDGQNEVNNNKSFYPGLLTGQNFDYFVRPSAAYGAGIRLIPWKWVAFKFELRNFTGLNPSVESDDPEIANQLDINNMPMLQVGISFLL